MSGAHALIEYENLSCTNKLFEAEYKAAFERFLQKGWYVLGDEVKRFEEEFAAFVGTKYCVGVASGLDALILSLECLELPKGSDVLVPSNTYIASILAIVRAGLNPILVEPDIHTYNINPAELRRKCTANTKAVLVVHLYGKPCRMDEIGEFCKQRGLKLVEDCAQSHGALFNGKMTGAFGDAGAFSFYPTKNLGALGDAGAICTDSKEYADKIRAYRNYGSEIKYHNKYLGMNSRLDELQAAFLRIKLRHINEITEKKRRLAGLYFDGLDQSKFILPEQDKNSFDVFHIFNVRCERRDELKAYLLENGIKTEIHYPIAPNRQPAMHGILDIQEPTPFAEEIHNTTLSLPISFCHTEEDVRRVIEVMNRF
ncbi:MAG: DegT/DnrJ/EryC1/StrS family aminotransferase [Bacteroides sp.]|nr:DegT/DnrJ/EryC1/StrS family aminotransferase [Prevotella sp.]MCM1407862.1 DegT/DnrJ/EryC1/StrS family aminotransferase [Treponema brennaborense]MCM1469604.1 DegT/DnrJ/EryC1/StrS family aminotransferase [Bacteroides sp.]